MSYADLKDDQTALRRRPLWKRALLRVQAGEMPPEGEKPLTADEKKLLQGWMAHAIEYLDCSEGARDPGPTVLRRLNRTEYDLTIRDLLGIDFHSAEAVGMPDEAVVDGCRLQLERTAPPFHRRGEMARSPQERASLGSSGLRGVSVLKWDWVRVA